MFDICGNKKATNILIWTISCMAKKEIPIEKLEVGMFVVGIDVSWFKTPFFRHSMLIADELQISTLKNCGVKTVTIDLEKGNDITSHDSQKPEVRDLSTAVKKIRPTALSTELDTARHIKESAKKTMRTMFSMIRDGGTPKEETLSVFIDQTMDSLLRNSQALIKLFLSRQQTSLLHNHAFNVMSISLLMGHRLGYASEDVRRLGLTALLMDIGWLQISERLFTLQTIYTDEEFSQVKKHVDFSLEILEKGNFDPEIHQAIAQHHEHYDGSGYPAELRGEQIHPLSRILSLVDHFDSLINGYYDQSRMIPARALQEIYKKSLSFAHDPALTALLIQIIGVFPPSTAVLLNTGERGIVTQVNWRAPIAPKIKIYYNNKLMPMLRPLEVDLSKQEYSPTPRKIQAIVDVSISSEDPAGLLVDDE